MNPAIVTTDQVRKLSETHIIEEVSNKQYSKSQAIIRAKGGMPKDCTRGGKIMLEKLDMDCPHLKPSPSGRLVARYQVINVVPDPKLIGGVQ